MRKSTLGVLLSLLLVAWPALAQEQRGSIQGVVKDNSGAVLPGATVEARSNAGAVASTTTDANGVYRFPSLAPGIYEVTAILQGFSPQKLGNVPVRLGDIKTVDLSLGVGGVAEKVQVTAEAPLIDVKQSGRSTNIRAEQIDLMPHNRDFTSLVTMAPGANNEPKSNGIMIDGASASENRYIVDGMETTDLVHGMSGKNLVSDFVEEVQVKSSGYTAEYGGSTGGVINVITKSGTNNLMGNALGYWQGSSMRGANTPTLRLGLTDSTKAEYITYAKDDSNRFEPGGSLGGPIVQNKAWFFAAYQPALTSIDRTVTLKATGSPVTVNQKQTVQYLTASQTAQISDKLRTRAAFNNSWNKQKGLLPSLDGSDSVGTNYLKTSTNPNWSLSGNADYVVSPKFFVGVRAGFFNTNAHDSNVPNESRFLFSGGNNLSFPNVPADLQHSTGYTSILSNNAVDHDKLTRAYFQGDATWYAHAAGEHQIKLGVQYDRRAENIVSGELAHRVTLKWGQALTLADGTSARGPFGYYSVRSNAVLPKQGFITQGNVQTNLVGLFAQDAWTINNKLTINVGIRTESEKVPAYSTEPGVPVSPIEFGYGDKVAPRAGFAYDLKGDGKWKAYGSWGIFYDIFKLELPQGSFGGQKWLEYYYTLDTVNYPTLDQGAGCPPACSGTLIQGPINFRVPSVSPGNDIEPDLKPMRSQEAVFGLEHQLNDVMAVGARYVHKQIDRGIEDTGSIDAAQNEIYIIANPGEGLTEFAYGNVKLPKPKRDYDAVEFSFDKRFANSWSFRGAYTIARDYGNYPGLSESDEDGRADPNVGRLYDYPLIMFKGDGNPNYGPLPTDRRHQIKLSSVYQFKFGTSIGAFEYVASGLPITREIGVIPPNNFPVQWLGRGSDGRTDVLSQTDLFVAHDFRMGGRRTIQVSINVLNLFNQGASISAFPTYNNGPGINVDQAVFYAHGSNFDQTIATAIAAGKLTPDPRFLMNNRFQDPLQARLGVKFTF